MKKITVLEKDYATMVYYPEVKIVHNTFRGQPTSEQFRESLNAGVDALEKYGGSKWLSDDLENAAVFSPEDQDWADNDWYPRMVNAGWKTWAMVVPREIKARINLIDIIDKNLDRGIRIEVFSQTDEALQWLIKVTD